jgi:hypothetical protein
MRILHRRRSLLRIRRELCSQLRGLTMLFDPETHSIRRLILQQIAFVDSELMWMSES